MELHLVLTSACNLDCAYCYQRGARSPARMDRDALQAAIRTVVTSPDPPHRVLLSGGEPFLARDLVRDAVAAVREQAGPSEATCTVLSNGTLLDDGDLAHLAASDAGLQLSVDGVESAQAHRAPGILAVLERLIDRAFERHPSWAARRLSTVTTLHAATVPTLAESIRSLFSRGVREVSLAPLVTHDPAWTSATRKQLEVQVGRIVEDSLVHWEESGEIPVGFLRQTLPRSGVDSPASSPFVCAAASCSGAAVDPAGRAWSCLSFVPTVQSLPPLGRDVAAALHLGDVRSPELLDRLEALPRRTGSVPLLRTSPHRRSSRGRCSDCDHASECLVCPASTCFVPGNDDPHWIPDNQCDFQQVTLDARRSFQVHVEGVSLLREMRRRTRALRRLARALDGPGVSPTGPAGA